MDPMSLDADGKPIPPDEVFMSGDEHFVPIPKETNLQPLPLVNPKPESIDRADINREDID